ncbi:MAG: amidohydrolase [Chloroflexi bacterium]|nr:amidohydrolase [Chloroflexota bacterium]
MIIDMRVRPPARGFLGLSIFRYPPASYAPTRFGAPLAPSYAECSMDLLLQEMDEAGVTLGVAMGRQAAPIWGSVPNEDIVAIVREYPGRFVGFAGVDVTDLATALRDVERAAHEWGFRGVNVEPAVAAQPLYADDRHLYPVYARCQDLGLPVSISLSAQMGPDMTYSDPLRVQRVAKDFPGLRIVISHAAWPWVMAAVGAAFTCGNVYLSPDLYMLMPELPGALDYVHAANSFMGDRLLFGSAYPVRPIKESVEAFHRLPLRPELVRPVLYDNAARLLGLS